MKEFRKYMSKAPNERTSGNGAAALLFSFLHLRRAVPECER
jgi:hypothetical protein